MRLAILSSAVIAFSLQLASAKDNFADNSDSVSAAAVVHELNLARQNPSVYANFVAEARPLHMIERGRAVDEAVHFLKKARPLPPLTLSSGMSPQRPIIARNKSLASSATTETIAVVRANESVVTARGALPGAKTFLTASRPLAGSCSR